MGLLLQDMYNWPQNGVDPNYFVMWYPIDKLTTSPKNPKPRSINKQETFTRAQCQKVVSDMRMGFFRKKITQAAATPRPAAAGLEAPAGAAEAAAGERDSPPPFARVQAGTPASAARGAHE